MVTVPQMASYAPESYTGKHLFEIILYRCNGSRDTMVCQAMWPLMVQPNWHIVMSPFILYLSLGLMRIPFCWKKCRAQKTTPARTGNLALRQDTWARGAGMTAMFHSFSESMVMIHWIPTPFSNYHRAIAPTNRDLIVPFFPSMGNSGERRHRSHRAPQMS